MRFKNNFFNAGLGIIILLVIILLLTYITPILKSVVLLIATVLFPIVISYVFYYLLRPLRNFLEKKIPRLFAIFLIFFSFVAFLFLAYVFISPFITLQVAEFIATPKEKMKEMENKTLDIMNLFNFVSLPQEQLRKTLIEFLQKITRFITTDIAFTLGSVATVATYFIITPFILFYLLKDDYKMMDYFISLVPRTYQKEAKKILYDSDEVLSSYITGQVIVAMIVGTIILVGYWIIGLNYALLMAFIAFIFNLIPFCGPFISTIPALLIGLSQSPEMGLQVIAIVLFAHFCDLNLISPRVVGARLQIHPITIILLLVSSASIVGILGLFAIIPIYAVIKVTLRDLYQLRLAKQRKHRDKLEEEELE